VITRFAPSPTGPLHIGHAYSALLAYEAAQKSGETFLLRIEDFDSTRCRPAHEAQIYDDLAWLGLTWPTPRRQSEHKSDYANAIVALEAQNLVFPCDCNRKLILSSGTETGPDGPIYHRKCCDRSMSTAKPTDAIRLNLQKACDVLPATLSYTEQDQIITFKTADLPAKIGAPILRRKDTTDPAYHLTCTHDDALQGVTHVIRGKDVAPLTPIHVVLQKLMDWPTPHYYHHDLITDEAGKRLAKIDKSKSIASYRAEGATPNDIRGMVGLPDSLQN
jgi:glutamyl-Q tRNA(Asp) synthetase